MFNDDHDHTPGDADDRGLAYHSEQRHRGYKIRVYTIPVAVGGGPVPETLRDGYVSVIDDSLEADADLEDAPRDIPEETIANAKELIDSLIDGELDDVEDGTAGS